MLPLYPHFSISTSASSLRLFEAMLQQDEELEVSRAVCRPPTKQLCWSTHCALLTPAVLSQGLKHTVIASWYWRDGYLTAMADLIENELHKFSEPESVMIFFSAHGVPKSYVEEFGDPYKEEIEQCVSMVMEKLQRRKLGNQHTLAYQSRVGPVRISQSASAPDVSTNVWALNRRFLMMMLLAGGVAEAVHR